VISARGPTNATDVFHFGRGGNQGGEGSDVAAEWFIDNVLEELDAGLHRGTPSPHPQPPFSLSLCLSVCLPLFFFFSLFSFRVVI